MVDIFQIIDHITRIEELNRVFIKPNFKPAQPSLQLNEVNLGETNRYNQTYDQSYNGHSHQVQLSDNVSDNNRQQRGLLKNGQGQPQYKSGPKKMTCYYCKDEHKIKDYVKLTKERAKDK